jgi:cephalosporin-C deacetylase-like acetyl esterase
MKPTFYRMKRRANPDSFSEKLSLWGVDRPAIDSGMLLNFIEKLAQNQNVPPLAQTCQELRDRRSPLQMRLRHSLGLFPWPEKTTLNARVAGELKRSGYKIEKLVYEAWEGLPVSAHLYLPEHVKKPCPGLIYACGHWMEAGKLKPHIQSFCAAAAILGIVTLVYDPIGQGERLVSWREHGHLDALLMGQCQLGWMVWESIRALDYLLSRCEVDPQRVGMTGSSGGGLNTFFTTAIEDRFNCAIPVAYPCTFFEAMRAERDLNWEDGMDMCNQVPQVMSYAEMSDIASLFIPKPYLILTGIRDKIFPVAGTRKIAADLEHNYRLAGVPERFQYVEFDEEHGYALSLRQAAYGWLKRWLLGEGDGSPVPEPDLDLLPDPYPVEYSIPPAPTPHHWRNQSPTLTPAPGAVPGFCFPTHKALDSEAILREKIRAKTETNSKWPPLPAQLAELPGWQKEIRRTIQNILGPFPEQGPLHTRLFNQVCESGILAERITFQSEEGITIPGLLILPENWKHPIPVVIYAGEWGKIQGLRSGLIEDVVGAGYGVLAIDVRGVGETATSDFEAATNLLMMDRPLFGQRVFDVIRAVDFIWERCYLAPQIDKGRLVIAGEGVGGLWGLYAASLNDRVAAVVALETIYSYKALLVNGANYPASVYLFDILKHLDLAHVIAACAPCPVYLQPVDGRRQPCVNSDIAVALQPAREAFALSGVSAETFKVSTSTKRRKLTKWLDLVLDRKNTSS